MDRQLRLKLGADMSAAPPVALSTELQEQLVALMADAITAILEQDGGDDD